MNIALDVIAAAIVIVCIVKGAKDGFIKTVFGLLSNIIALALAFVLSAPLGTLLNNLFFADFFETRVTEYVAGIEGTAAVSAAETAIEKLFELPSVFNSFVSRMGGDAAAVTNAYSGADTIAHAREAAIAAIYQPVSTAVSRVVAFVAVFIVAIVLLFIVNKLLNKLFSKGIFGCFNRVAGLAAGAAIALLMLFALCTGVRYLMPFSQSFERFAVTEETIENTLIFKYCYNNNPVARLFSAQSPEENGSAES